MRPFWDHMMAFSLIILINHNQALFLAIKLTVTLGCTAILWKIRDRAIAKVGVILALIVYLYILYKHIWIAYNIVCLTDMIGIVGDIINN